MSRAAAAALRAAEAPPSPPVPVPAAAPDGAHLRRYLLGEWKMGVLTARQVCTLAYHATTAGAIGVEDLSLPPTSTHFAEHVRKAVGMIGETGFYEVEVPMWDKVQEKRVMRPIHINLPHDVFAKEATQHPD
eukprot:851758-Pyramimonas_sp.AAC.1